MRAILILALLSVIGISRAVPIDPSMEEDPELTPGFFEGDIVLRSVNRNGMSNSSQYWPNGIVYYKFWEGFDEERKVFIKRVMKMVENVSCVRFQEAGDKHPYFVNVTGNPGGCYSSIGFDKGISRLNLEPHPLNTGCYIPGKIIHEWLHVFGFYHMHSTYNRDNYVRIAYENIKPKRKHNFKKYPKRLVNDFGVKYDYGSIMHYSSTAFSANGKETIIPLQRIPNGVLGQRARLSEADIFKLNKMYNCYLNCTDTK